MHLEELGPWTHGHAFGTAVEASGERRTRWVVALTLAMMVGEIAAGMVYGSMALLADGWHMGTHAAALGVAAFAYAYARRHAADPRYSFGTGKVGALGGFASAVGLAVVALLVLGESAVRLASPVAIRFDQAIGVAVLGLLVNLFSAFLLRDEDHGHAHGHGDPHDHDQHQHDHREHDHDHDHEEHAHGHHDPGHVEHRDHNLRAAYLHVLADALTSVLAIVALLAGRVLGWTWMDPVMGIVGALVIARWSVGLLRDTGAVLLDAEVAEGRRAAVRAALEQGEDRVADLHLWRVGPRHLAAIVSVVSPAPRAPAEYKDRLRAFPDLVHLTVEVHACETLPGARASR
ncbi:CDF family Co(II)/Ni(II) efflux transporter DmeF [Anaeromyxobacter sp. PSR-1]|uniref:CDF family Co(II)/Ni(II) efflux transporter DmeF n=1 Tax=Anaeromyxobacter sp. PSR-1 TaxID=1300915 RepID=UPI0005E871E9|nr:CDF family Co(II)/Ni(II) efflux transporter DmeF [Anaeromyxobacter sp. PSR-1]GAO05551.1 zinc transporter ZitB [Anaeromyxobacter sp. PSR-1]